MSSVVSAIRDTISISLFNRGLAGKIFAEVKQTGPKVVMKNNVPEVVLISPNEYIQLMEEINDARLMTIANERMAQFDSTNTLSQEEVNLHLGISEKDLADFDEVEFE